jgi:5-methyltetrahydrofolate--homocysteine methyltransferase
MRRDPIYTERARDLRKNANDAEQKLWSYLRGRQLDGYKFRRQHALGQYIADFICLPARLVIELDGDTHGNDERQRLDAIRTESIERAGYRVIRFWNDEVFDDVDEVIEEITNALRKVPSPHRGEG